MKKRLIEELKITAGCLLVMAACIFLGIFIKSAYDHMKGREEYDTLRDSVSVTEDADEGRTDTVAEKKEETKPKNLVVNWDDLLAKNSDYVGWLEMAGNISYPVVKSTNNSFYLSKGFSKEYNVNGSIFMHCDCQADWSSRNTVLYGHNMFDGSMFGGIEKFRNGDYLRANDTIYIHVKGGKRVYKVFDCIFTEDTTEPYNVSTLTDEETGAFIQAMKRMSSVWVEENMPSQEDNILTLSTCVGRVGTTRRQIIQAKYIGTTPYRE